MNRAMHATLARALIDASGGLETAVEVVRACDNRGRISKSMLSDYQNPNASLYMPADIIGCLEKHCGRAIYSRRLFEQTEAPVGDLRDDACRAVEDAASFMSAVRQLAQSPISPRVAEALRRLVIQAEEDLERAGNDIELMVARDAA